MDLPLIDIIVFLVYMFGIVIFGASFYFRNKSADAYTSGGGNLPSWAVGMSIFATYVSSISFLALPGKAYQSDWNGLVFSFSIPLAAYISIRFFIPLYRSINNISAYHYLEIRFGYWARIYASSCYMLTQIARMGAIMYLLALPMNAFFGWDINMVIILTGISVIFYSMMGGIQAVVWTDTIQGIILIAGALVCVVILFFSMPEGPGQLFDIALAHNKFSLGGFSASLSESTFWVILIYGLFINLQNFGVDQGFVQRYMTTSTEKGAKISTWLGSLLYLPVSLVFFFIGTSIFAFYQAIPGKLPASLQSTDMADRVFPFFIVSELPTGLIGLLIASIFAAGMSTISTSLNSSATLILSDFYKRYFRKDASETASMRVLYIATAFMGVLGILAALAMTKVTSALDAWWALASIFSGGMLGLFLLGYFSPKARSFNAAVGVIVGVLLICWISLSPTYFTEGAWVNFKSPLHTNLAIVVGTTAIFVVGFFLANFMNRRKKPIAADEVETIL